MSLPVRVSEALKREHHGVYIGGGALSSWFYLWHSPEQAAMVYKDGTAK